MGKFKKENKKFLYFNYNFTNFNSNCASLLLKHAKLKRYGRRYGRSLNELHFYGFVRQWENHLMWKIQYFANIKRLEKKNYKAIESLQI